MEGSSVRAGRVEVEAMDWEGKAEMIESREEWGESISESRFEIGLEMGEKRSVRCGELIADAGDGGAVSTLSLSEGVGFRGAGVKSMNWSKWEKSPDEVLPIDPLRVRVCLVVSRGSFEKEEDDEDEGEYDNSGSSLDASLPPITDSQVFLNEILRRPFEVVIIPPSDESLQ